MNLYKVIYKLKEGYSFHSATRLYEEDLFTHTIYSKDEVDAWLFGLWYKDTQMIEELGEVISSNLIKVYPSWTKDSVTIDELILLESKVEEMDPDEKFALIQSTYHINNNPHLKTGKQMERVSRDIKEDLFDGGDKYGISIDEIDDDLLTILRAEYLKAYQ